MGLKPTHISQILEEWKTAKQRETDTLIAWHDVQTPELLTTWANAKIELLDKTEQLELDLGITTCTQLSAGPYSR